MKIFGFPLFLILAFSHVEAQVAELTAMGAKKVRIETTNYLNSDTSKSTAILYFDSKGNVIKAIKYDAANEPLELWTYSFKYEKSGHIRSSQSKFKDYSKQLKPQKFKSVYNYNADGKLVKVENTQNQSGFECMYDSIGRIKGKNDYNSKGFFGGSKFFYKDNQVFKQKYEWSNKPPETSEFTYNGMGRRVKAMIYRGQKLIRKEEYLYFD